MSDETQYTGRQRAGVFYGFKNSKDKFSDRAILHIEAFEKAIERMQGTGLFTEIKIVFNGTNNGTNNGTESPS